MLRVLNMFKNFGSPARNATPEDRQRESGVNALNGVSLEIKTGEFFSLLGPSGCGKTTLLRIIAGFETATSGELFWNENRIDNLRPQDRPFNMVFQRYALFPHLTVFENVAFGLRVKHVDDFTLRKRVENALSLVGLWNYRDRLPDTLSGGQAQRIAVARAIVNEPKILLLDEPLSALDQKMREYMQTELRELQRRLGITFIFVTHDQQEAFALSDRIGVMNNGNLEQVATPEELYERPSTHFVAQFVGSMGSIRGSAVDQHSLQMPNGQLIRGNIKNMGIVQPGVQAEAFVRPEKVQLGSSPEHNALRATVLNMAFKGLHYELHLGIGPEQRLRAFVPPEKMNSEVHVGASVTAHFSPADTFIFSCPSMGSAVAWGPPT